MSLPITVVDRETAAFRLTAAQCLLGPPDGASRAALADVLALVRAGEEDPELAWLAAGLGADLVDLGRRGGFAEAEYGRLFVDGPPPAPCLPVEAFYREGVCVGSVSSEVAILLAEEGLGPLQLPADHAITELALVQHLLDPAAGAGLAGVLRARAVLEDHVLLWLPGWAEHVAQATRHPFFARAAAFARRAALLAAV